MTVSYMEIMSLIGNLAVTHPTESNMAVQTYNTWNSHTKELNQIFYQYQQSAKAATGTFDQIGILLELAKMHPVVATLLINTLTTWKDHIPQLIQMIQEIQASAQTST